jgi:hypothetical protein
LKLPDSKVLVAGAVLLFVADLFAAKALQVSVSVGGSVGRRGRGSRPHGELFFGGSWAPAVTGNEVVKVVFDSTFFEFVKKVGGYSFFEL